MVLFSCGRILALKKVRFQIVVRDWTKYDILDWFLEWFLDWFLDWVLDWFLDWLLDCFLDCFWTVFGGEGIGRRRMRTDPSLMYVVSLWKGNPGDLDEDDHFRSWSAFKPHLCR
jgi:hypothetical protein